MKIMSSEASLICMVNKLTQCLENESQISKNSSFVKDLATFDQHVTDMGHYLAQATLPLLVTPFLVMHAKNDFCVRFSESMQIKILDILNRILAKTNLNDVTAFRILHSWLLGIIYDAETIVKPSSEELKSAILECLISLHTRTSMQISPLIYIESHMPMFCALLHLCTHLLRREECRKLQYLAVECIMCMQKVDDHSDLSDVVLLSQIAALFNKYLPGMITRLISTMDNDRCGHALLIICIKAWGRLVSMHMREYEPVSEFQSDMERAMKQYDRMNARSASDHHISTSATFLMRHTNSSHHIVLKQLVDTCELLIDTCFLTLPNTISKIVEILIVISQSTLCESNKSEAIIEMVAGKLLEDNHSARWMLDKFLENFYTNLSNLPTVFLNVDTSAKITALRLLEGYLRLFRMSDNINFVLFKRTNLERLLRSLLLIATVEKTDISLLEEYSLHDWDSSPDNRTPWKVFTYVNDSMTLEKLYSACRSLVQPRAIDIVIDYLQEIFHQDPSQRSEVVIILNEVISADSNLDIDSNREGVLDLYLDPMFWDLDLTITHNTPLKEIQSNIVQICLQLEGIGKIALVMKSKFKNHLLKTLYAVLEKAGSGHTLLRAAGLACIANISRACGYKTITDLINNNADYFSYHVVNKLRRLDNNSEVLTVLGVVLNYSSMDVLNAISGIIEGVLMQCFDQYREQNIEAYLQLFFVFIKAMHRWLKVEVVLEPMKSKQEKERELEERTKQYMEEMRQQDFSDNVMMGTSEEMFVQDLRQSIDELGDQESDEMPSRTPPPKHIQLIVAILERSLHFLPAKQDERKIIVLEILNLGVEILKDYEDDLLPIVHKIWSPLVHRFKETPLIINLSFKLLSTLGRLAKDFIRMRSIKEVLPEINGCLVKQCEKSLLKDKGSAYRYTQGYKMQLNVLSLLGRFAYDLDLGEQVQLIEEGVQVYLSEYQPIPLQQAALEFHRCICFFDCDLFQTFAERFIDKHENDKLFMKNIRIIEEMMKERKTKNDNI